MTTNEKSIAVLPFVNLSGDPENEYFSDGITEEIINALTLIEGLKVIARTSSFAFKNKNIDIRAIGSQLGVGTILEGSVRKVKQRVRITAQLINANDGTHFWSKNFDRNLEDIFALQDQVSTLIADQIRENYGHLEIPSYNKNTPTKNMDAYNLVLKGEYLFKRKDFDDIQRALQLFKDAIELDKNYFHAYSALAETYMHVSSFGLMSSKEAHDLARQACLKSIELNEHNAKAHKVLAYIKLFYDWEWKSALEEYNKAIKYGLPHQNEFITYYYIFIEEDFERAIEICKKVIDTDPLHVIVHWQLGLTYYFARQFEESIKAFDRALEIDPFFAESLRFRGLVYGILGDYDKGLNDINKALVLSNGEGNANYDMLVVKILMGKKKESLATIKKTEYLDSCDPAGLYALLNMQDEAISYLEKAFTERSVMMVTLKNFWLWDNLKDNPKFQQIYERMNFPESTKKGEILSPIVSKELLASNSSIMTEDEIEINMRKLNHYINDKKVYINPELSLRDLAKEMDIHSNKLSWLVNEHLGKSFNEYINSLRLESFKSKALDPNNSHLTILGLAYESGFNSKTVFNTYFKKKEGQTPSVWLKRQKK